MFAKPFTVATIISIIIVFLVNPISYAEEETDNQDYQQLKQEIVQEVIEELRDSKVLQEAVQDGIREFILRQQQAQTEAQEQQQRQADEKVQDVRPVSPERDHIYGNPDAPVSLIEYSDFECPFCKRFHPTAKKLVDQSSGRVNWVYRHFPLNFHNPGAQREAEASECAAELGGNDAFWAYADAIYERTTSNGDGFPLDQLVPLAGELDLDKAAFKECFESRRYENRVKEDYSEGIRIGISGTPGNVLLNNKTGQAVLRAGAQPLAVLEQAAQTLLDGR